MDRLVEVLLEVVPKKTLSKKLKTGYYKGQTVAYALEFGIDPQKFVLIFFINRGEV